MTTQTSQAREELTDHVDGAAINVHTALQAWKRARKETSVAARQLDLNAANMIYAAAAAALEAYDLEQTKTAGRRVTRTEYALADVLGLTDHATSYSWLSPFQQSSLEQAKSTLGNLDGQHVSVIGWDDKNAAWNAAKHVGAYYDAEKAAAIGMDVFNEYARLGPKVKNGEIPPPYVVSVPSATSAKAAVVFVIHHNCNAMGYGDNRTATVAVESIHPDIDAANKRCCAIGDAVRTLYAIVNSENKRNETWAPVDRGDYAAFARVRSLRP